MGGYISGLFRLRKNAFERITAGGRLQPSPVRIVTVDPGGTVWMGIDGKDKIPATVVGYDPDSNDIRTFTPDQGLPEAATIEMIDYTWDGQLAVMAGEKLVRGRVFVPSRFPIFILIVLVAIIAGGFTIALRFIQRRRAEINQYKPLLETAREFFQSFAKKIERVNYRTLKMLSKKEEKIPIRGRPW